jgi:hypothetical protein
VADRIREATLTVRVELWVATKVQCETEARAVLVGPAWVITVDCPRWIRTDVLTP